ncbi:hypothetical protein ACFWHB_11715 [Aeromonas mytilicola subsp. aquatica]|uniref:hypothetical protein n=1 Tax=Aeromonas mytilicola TaxID=3377113 RepID=UPI0037BEEA88
MKLRMLSAWLTLLVTVPAHAIGINSMLEYSDPKGRAEFTITNTEDQRQYITVLITELIVENGELRKEPYTRDNVDKWVMSAHPARAIVEPGFKKSFLLMYQPIVGEPVNKDRVFQVSFAPTPYFDKEDEISQNSSVKMAFGFAPLVIVPAKEAQPLAYDMTYRGDSVTVVNRGNTAFTLYLDGCPQNTADKERSKCSTDAVVLAGRKLNLTLPAVMVSQSTLKAKMATYGNKFKAEATLRKQS